MNKIKIPEINLSEYDYELPKDRIALYPVDKRDESRLLSADVDSGEISHYNFKDLPNIIPDNSDPTLNPIKIYNTGKIPPLNKVLKIPMDMKFVKKLPSVINPINPIIINKVPDRDSIILNHLYSILLFL